MPNPEWIINANVTAGYMAMSSDNQTNALASLINFNFDELIASLAAKLCSAITPAVSNPTELKDKIFYVFD